MHEISIWYRPVSLSLRSPPILHSLPVLITPVWTRYLYKRHLFTHLINQTPTSPLRARPNSCLTFEVYLRWKLQISPFFVSGKIWQIGSVSNTYLPHCILHTPITKAIWQIKVVIIVFGIDFFKLLSDWASTFLFHLPVQNIHLSRTSGQALMSSPVMVWQVSNSYGLKQRFLNTVPRIALLCISFSLSVSFRSSAQIIHLFSHSYEKRYPWTCVRLPYCIKALIIIKPYVKS